MPTGAHAALAVQQHHWMTIWSVIESSGGHQISHLVNSSLQAPTHHHLVKVIEAFVQCREGDQLAVSGNINEQW
jgi:hypothetical protein